jgi:ABC-type nitrate/sulfonate/bicarbonate transport system permease component
MSRRERVRLLLGRLAIVLGVLALVEAAVRSEWISPFFLTAPSHALRVFGEELASGRVAAMVLITLYEIAAALAAATLAGVLVGLGLWRYRNLGRSSELLLGALFASPVILTYPVFLVVFGRTPAAIITLSALFGFIPIAINTKSAFQHINPVLLRVGSSMRLTRRQLFRHVMIPAAAPTVFSGFRLGLTYILKSVIGLEYIVQVGGIGMWVSDAAYRFDIAQVYAGVAGTVLLSLAFLYAINRAEGLVRR